MAAKTASELHELIRGDVIVPDGDEFEDARKVHNGMIDKRPAVIVRVANAGDRQERRTGGDDLLS